MNDDRRLGSAHNTVSQEEALRRIRDAERLFCFVDYDGTLAPIAPTPDDALPLPGTAALLAELAAALHTHVAIITGRTIESVRRLLDVPGGYYVGIHGIELRRPDGTQDLAKGAALMRALLPRIKRQIEDDLGPARGILLEDKGAAVACHYRLASRADALRARQAVARIARQYRRRGLIIDVLDGHEVSEIRPASVTKGTMVSSLLATCGPRTLALYIGDDRTDAEAFAALPPDGIAIHVGPSAPPQRADVFLPDPHAVHEFLRAVLRARSMRGPEE